MSTSRAQDLVVPRSESEAIRKSYRQAPPASWTDKPAAASDELRRAWDGYYGALEELRASLENSSMFLNPRYRAKAYHIMMEVQAFAYNMTVAPRMDAPRIHTNTGWRDDLYSVGLVAPDWAYGLMYLDGSQTYRLTGRYGDCELILIQVISRSLGVEDGETLGNYNIADMDVADDGHFEVTIGGPKLDRNWVGLDESSNFNFVFLRTKLNDYGNEDIGGYRIDRISEVGPKYYEREEFDEAAVAERIYFAEMSLRIWINEFTIGPYDFAMAGSNGQVNQMSLAPGLTFVGGSQFCRYAQGVFSIEDYEALIIELDRKPGGPYWGCQLADVWSRSLQYSRYQTSLNDAQAVWDSDGRCRLVVSTRDPGVANWLDTRGHADGEIFFRNYLTSEGLVPILHKVKLSELDAHLPADTARVTPEERAAAVAHRREGFLKLYGE